MATLTADVLDIDDLDLTKCVVGPDHVLLTGEAVTLYRREGRHVELVGVFADPADALDAIDAPPHRSATGISG
jgi:hypothetical protein